MSVVVSDTSPLRALAHLGLLHLVPDMFEDVLIPPAVLAESEAAVLPLMDRLKSGLNFYISAALRAEIIRLAGE